MKQTRENLKQSSDLQAQKDLQTLLTILPAEILQKIQDYGRQEALLEIVMDFLWDKKENKIVWMKTGTIIKVELFIFSKMAALIMPK